MTEHDFPKSQVGIKRSGAEYLSNFEQAVTEYNTVRVNLASLGSIVAKQPGGPTEHQRERLKELSSEHFTQCMTVTAMAGTLLANGLLTRCGALIRQHGEGLH